MLTIFGYTENKIHPVHGPAIQRMFQIYMTPRGIRETAAQMNQEGYTNQEGGPWTHGLVGYVLDQLWVYAGYVEKNKRSKTGKPFTRVRGKHPPLISKDWAQQIAQERGIRGHGRRNALRSGLFSGMITCTSCDKTLYIHRKKQRGKIYNRYMCDGCKRSIAESLVIDAVQSGLTELQPLLDPQDVTHINRILRRTFKIQLDTDRTLHVLCG